MEGVKKYPHRLDILGTSFQRFSFYCPTMGPIYIYIYILVAQFCLYLITTLFCNKQQKPQKKKTLDELGDHLNVFLKGH